jgi:hypothetical protein
MEVIKESGGQVHHDASSAGLYSPGERREIASAANKHKARMLECESKERNVS